MSEENGILEVETLTICPGQHTSLAQTSSRREADVARISQSAGRALPWFIQKAAADGSNVGDCMYIFLKAWFSLAGIQLCCPLGLNPQVGLDGGWVIGR